MIKKYCSTNRNRNIDQVYPKARKRRSVVTDSLTEESNCLVKFLSKTEVSNELYFP